MSQNPDPDMISFNLQIRIAGKRVLLRNALIGSAVIAFLASAAIYRNGWTTIDAVAPLIGGVASGLFGTLIAYIGQFAAQRDSSNREFRQPINWAAVKYSGLIMAWLGLILCAFIDIAIQESDGLALLITTAAVIIGALIGSGLTLASSTAMRALHSRKSNQMLGEGGFDSLRAVDSREHARR